MPGWKIQSRISHPIGPSGMSFYTGSRYPGWKNSLFLSALVGQKLIRFEIKDRQITHQEIVYQGFGRTRDVITGRTDTCISCCRIPRLWRVHRAW
jgi:glucose/arabinose dehydrogenase